MILRKKEISFWKGISFSHIYVFISFLNKVLRFSVLMTWIFFFTQFLNDMNFLFYSLLLLSCLMDNFSISSTSSSTSSSPSGPRQSLATPPTEIQKNYSLHQSQSGNMIWFSTTPNGTKCALRDHSSLPRLIVFYNIGKTLHNLYNITKNLYTYTYTEQPPNRICSYLYQQPSIPYLLTSNTTNLIYTKPPTKKRL